MPHVTLQHRPRGIKLYQVGGKSFVLFRTPRPDAVDPETGEPYPDVIMFWVPSEVDKQALLQDPSLPFFSTSHFETTRPCGCMRTASANSPGSS
ncbi:hypothetical protein ACWGNN_35790 [Streptomyces sp. NPDC055817]